MEACSEAEFLDDLVYFLEAKRQRSINRVTFPDAVLNGTKLDLFHLYKEVVSRGGFQ
jgi:ARID/BRIGHT DNA binding domain